jgi:hypothetical protein
MKVTTEHFRDHWKQKKFRRFSKSKEKSNKQVSHIIDLFMIQHIQRRMNEDEIKQVKLVLNSYSNLRMVKTKTNESTYRIISNSIIKKAKSKEMLTEREKKRASKQLNVIHVNWHVLPTRFRKKAIKFYKSFNL